MALYNAPTARPVDMQVLDHLDVNQDSGHHTASALGIDGSTARNALVRLAASGDIVRVGPAPEAWDKDGWHSALDASWRLAR